MSRKIHDLIGKRFDSDLGDFIDCEIIFNKRTNMWLRPDTFDRKSISECYNNYSDIDVNGKTVMDLGANIGGFVKMSIDKNAKKVIAIEPCPHNFQILSLNAPEAENLNIAVGEEDGEAVFHYASSKRNSVSSSTLKRRNASGVSITVSCKSFSRLLEEYKPQILKIDIEGKEYDILDSISEIPNFVEVVAIEFHNNRGREQDYISRFFPSSIWNQIEHPIIMFGKENILDYTFLRKPHEG